MFETANRGHLLHPPSLYNLARSILFVVTFVVDFPELHIMLRRRARREVKYKDAKRLRAAPGAQPRGRLESVKRRGSPLTHMHSQH